MSGQRHSQAADWQASDQASQLGSHPDSDVVQLRAACRELTMAREIRARELVAAAAPAAIAAAIRAQCEPAFRTTWIRAYRLALANLKLQERLRPNPSLSRQIDVAI